MTFKTNLQVSEREVIFYSTIWPLQWLRCLAMMAWSSDETCPPAHWLFRFSDITVLIISFLRKWDSILAHLWAHLTHRVRSKVENVFLSGFISILVLPLPPGIHSLLTINCHMQPTYVAMMCVPENQRLLQSQLLSTNSLWELINEDKWFILPVAWYIIYLKLLRISVKATRVIRNEISK